MSLHIYRVGEMFVAIVVLQVGPPLRSGRALHRVGAHGESKPGDGSLVEQMKQMSVGEYRFVVPESKMHLPQFEIYFLFFFSF
jgi:hypothetical protein